MFQYKFCTRLFYLKSFLSQRLYNEVAQYLMRTLKIGSIFLSHRVTLIVRVQNHNVLFNTHVLSNT